MTSRLAILLLLLCPVALAGCQAFVNDADREVYRLIEQRQSQALGRSRDASIDTETTPIVVPPSAYETISESVDPAIPEAFQQHRTGPNQPTTQPVSQPAELPPEMRVLTLSDALSYGFANAREFQTAKEELYLAALALSLERHLWTPQFLGQITTEYDNLGEDFNWDQTLTAVAALSVEQRLPYGGEVTARVVKTLMNELTDHINTAESGAIILEADIPLLRGAGRVARESRYQAERDLIYAVRAFERFRRVLAVELASDYFNLQRLRQEVLNATESIKVFTEEVQRAEAFGAKERLIPLEVQRAKQNLLVAINREVDAEEAYGTALDRFKIRLGMPTDMLIDVSLQTGPAPTPETQPSDSQNDTAASQPSRDDSSRALMEAVVMPAVSETEATEVALRYRLDLLNDEDRIDDTRRGVHVAENALLPDLRAFGSARFDTDPNQIDMFSYRTRRSTWNAGVTLEIPLDRKEERNALRASLIQKRRAQRIFEEARDVVKLEVRRAMRRVQQAETSLEIQIRNRDLAIERRRQARFQFERGDASNREVIEAEDALLDARNRLAQSEASLRLAILQFRRDTGTLRINEEGKWIDPTTWANRKNENGTMN